MTTLADTFVTFDRDKDGNDLRFEMIEDESGDVFWAYGHVPAPKLIDEVNAWFIHVDVVTNSFDLLFPDTTKVTYHAADLDADNERFTITNTPGADSLPVTRLVL